MIFGPLQEGPSQRIHVKCGHIFLSINFRELAFKREKCENLNFA